MLISYLSLPAVKFSSVQKFVRKLDEANLSNLAEITTSFKLKSNESKNSNWLSLKSFLLSCLQLQLKTITKLS